MGSHPASFRRWYAIVGHFRLGQCQVGYAIDLVCCALILSFAVLQLFKQAVGGSCGTARDCNSPPLMTSRTLLFGPSRFLSHSHWMPWNMLRHFAG